MRLLFRLRFEYRRELLRHPRRHGHTWTSGMGTMNCPPHSRMIGQLRHDFLLQIPGQNQHEVGTSLPDPIGRENRNMRARQKLVVLVGVAVDRVVDEVGSDAAVVQQGIALARCAVSGHRLVLSLRTAMRNSSSLRFVSFTCSVECPVGVEPVRVRPALRALLRFADGWFDRPRHVLGVSRVDPQRAPVGRDLLDVEQRQAVGGEHLFHREQREIGEVLVVDRIELVSLHQAHEMRELHRDHARAA